MLDAYKVADRNSKEMFIETSKIKHEITHCAVPPTRERTLKIIIFQRFLILSSCPWNVLD